MDGQFYHDTREPFMSVPPSAVTLSSTDKGLYPLAAFPTLGGQYWARPGKKLAIRAFGKITTGATPGNGTWDIYYGSGADATGTIIGSSGTLALSASQTNVSWMLQLWITCITTGSSGSLLCNGLATMNVGVLASTLQPMLIPATANAAVGSLDLTAANIISVQFKRSGSTAETMTVTDMEVSSLN